MIRYSNQGQTISINLDNSYQVYVMAKWDKKSSLYIAEMYIAKKETNSFLHFIDSFTVSCERMDLFMTLTKEISERYSETGFSDEISEYENILNAITTGYKDHKCVNSASSQNVRRNVLTTLTRDFTNNVIIVREIFFRAWNTQKPMREITTIIIASSV